MTIKKLLLISLCACILNACSNKQLYQGIQENNRSRCERELNESARQECLNHSAIDYESYTRERERLRQINDE